MNTLIEKLARVEKEIAQTKGGFWLFALLERDESPDRWDLVVSAPWLQEQSRKSLDIMIEPISASLDQQELIALSRIVVLSPTNPIVQHVTKGFKQEHGKTLLYNVVINGMSLRRAVVITSKSPTKNSNHKTRRQPVKKAIEK